MKDEMRLPDEQVKVKLALCGDCAGIVTVSVEHKMDRKMINEMARDAVKYNHSIKSIPLLDYREQTSEGTLNWCECHKTATP